MISADEFASKIESLNIHLFDVIPSQSLKLDKTSWLALQRAVGEAKDGYVYLEIGSHLGGSIQQYLPDPKCRLIYSIDKRPIETPDDRGVPSVYEGNSTRRMLRNLEAVSAESVDKIVYFENESKDIDPSLIEHAPDLCFIDGEHTVSSVMSDFQFCRRVCSRDAAIYFHDDWVVFPALVEIINLLKREGVTFRAAKLGGVTFAIFLGDCPASRDSRVLGMEHNVWRFFQLSRLKLAARRIVPPVFWPVARWFGSRLRLDTVVYGEHEEALLRSGKGD